MYGSAEKVTRGQDTYRVRIYTVMYPWLRSPPVQYSTLTHINLCQWVFLTTMHMGRSDALDRLVYSVCVCILRAEKCGPLLICIN
jgi:hypothetical protein